MASVGLPDPFAEPPNSPAGPNQKPTSRKSWKELHQAVRRTRKLGSTLFSRVPSNFSIKHIKSPEGGDTWTRLYFLGAQPGSHDNTLLYKDIPPQDNSQSLTSWNPLLEVLPDKYVKGNFSKEEQLLRERKRIGSYGITSYEYDEKAGRFLFPTTKSLFYCDDPIHEDNMLVTSVFPWHIESTDCSGARTDAKLCPTNANIIAFINNCDIWATHIKSGRTARLTFSHKGHGSSLLEDPKSSGVPSFVVQEEFDRYTGYWWQPQQQQADTPANNAMRGVSTYRVLFEEVDEEDVEIIHIASGSDDGKSFDEYRYPRAGTANAFCNLRMLEFQVNEATGTISSPVTKRLPDPLKCIFPWMEYILQAGWLPDGQRIYCTLLDRKQQRLALVLIDLAAFCVRYHDENSEMCDDSEPEQSPCFHVLYEDTSDVWVKAHNCLHFLPGHADDDDDELSFLWASDESGYRHLYKLTVKLDSQDSTVSTDSTDRMDSTDSTDRMESDEDFLRATVVQKVQLTSGEWDVSDDKLWVDEDHKLVYFIGFKDTPLETHLYCVSYEYPTLCPAQRLTQPGYSHNICMDKECSMFVSVYSSMKQPPASQVFRIKRHLSNQGGNQYGVVITEEVCSLLSPSASSSEYHPPELFSFQPNNGPTMHGMYYTPHDLQPDTRYPTLLFVYGGPQVQLVTNSYKAHRFLRLHTLASLGYAVVTIDSRGSANRGLQFESHIKHQLGTVEIADQVAGLQYIASKLSFIDMDRVAIHGWSYGGYLSLMGLVQRPDIFKVAVAGAPVTTWLLYDTGYTERYMDTPENNQDGYKGGSLLEYIDRFPDEENRLLIVHGLIDENVHFLHTKTLINGLTKACKPYRLQLYPNERHGIRNLDSSEHYETTVLSFLQQSL